MDNSKKTLNVITISLGSNIEPRFDFMKKSCDLIQEQIGTIIKFSRIYETPAWGFESTSFLNACIQIHTSLLTREVLLLLQGIEIKLGRKPHKGTTYQARTIDLDIIYSSEGIFSIPRLQVPHPLLHQRKFVLVPLADIVPNFKHPLLHKTTVALLECCTDASIIKESKFSF